MLNSVCSRNLPLVSKIVLVRNSLIKFYKSSNWHPACLEGIHFLIFAYFTTCQFVFFQWTLVNLTFHPVLSINSFSELFIIEKLILKTFSLSVWQVFSLCLFKIKTHENSYGLCSFNISECIYDVTRLFLVIFWIRTFMHVFYRDTHVFPCVLYRHLFFRERFFKDFPDIFSKDCWFISPF